MAEAKTDNAGHFELKRVPVGNYKLFIEAERGSAPAPTLPVQPGDCEPAPPVKPVAQASVAPGLAQTGSNLLLPVLAGLGIVALGAGAVLAARRRRA